MSWEQLGGGQVGQGGQGRGEVDAAAGQLRPGDHAMMRLDFPVSIGWAEGVLSAAVYTAAGIVGVSITGVHIESDQTLVIEWVVT